MAIKVTILASDDGERRHLETVLLATAGCTPAGRALPLADLSDAGGAGLRQVEAQTPRVVLVALPTAAGAGDIGVICAGVACLRERLPEAAVMAVGSLQSPEWIVAAMRAGASEYLERPLRAEALADAVTRLTTGSKALVRARARGKLLAVLGARGGAGATTVAVNLALSLQAQQRREDEPVLLLDAAPLGHTVLQLNLKPQYTLNDLLGQGVRLDQALLKTLVCRHESGMDVVAGTPAPLPAIGEAQPAGWLELLLGEHPWVVADLSSRLDALSRALLDRADRILLVTQTDMVSLWSAAKVRQFLDPAGHRAFETILNRYGATPAADLDELASITQTTVLWKLPNAHAQVMEAIERGQPPALGQKTELARSFRALAAQLLGRPPERRSWLPFLRAHTATTG